MTGCHDDEFEKHLEEDPDPQLDPSAVRACTPTSKRSKTSKYPART